MKDELAKKVLGALVAVAKSNTGGHFTIMRFTTNWRVQIGYQDFAEREAIEAMPKGATFEEAALAAIEAAMRADSGDD